MALYLDVFDFFLQMATAIAKFYYEI